MNLRTPNESTQAGFSLVELMVAITIGLLVMAGLTTIFVNSNQARSEIEKTNRQIENGRYAIQLLTDDLRLSGFYGELDPTLLAQPTATPNPCATTPTTLAAALPIHVQGYDNSAGGLGCLSSADIKSDTDILVVRHASTCFVGDTDCDAQATGVPYLQVSLCNKESGTPFNLDTDTTQLTRTQINCSTPARLRRYRTHIYFIANNDNPSDGIPTLKRAELGAGGFTIVPLVEGIENLQIEYGIDTDCDGMPDVYNADPNTYVATYTAACPTPATPNWRNVMSVKVNLLARNTEKTLGYTDTKTYSLGLKADNSANTVGPFNDNIKRHVYQAMVRLSNAIGRRQQ